MGTDAGKTKALQVDLPPPKRVKGGAATDDDDDDDPLSEFYAAESGIEASLTEGGGSDRPAGRRPVRAKRSTASTAGSTSGKLPKSEHNAELSRQRNELTKAKVEQAVKDKAAAIRSGKPTAA